MRFAPSSFAHALRALLPSPRRFARAPVLALGACLLMLAGGLGVSHAQTIVYFDTNGNTAGSGTGSVTWTVASSTYWSTAANGGAVKTWGAVTGATTNKNATFSAGTNATGTYTVSLVGTADYVGGLTFQEGNVTLTGGGLNLRQTATVNVAATQATIASTISSTSGTFGLIKSGNGTLTLAGANTYTGGTQLQAGTLEVSQNSALGTGTLTLTGGTLRAGGGARTLANAVTANGNFTIGGSNDLTFSGPLNLGAGNRTFTISNTGVTTFAGVVSNSYYATTTKTGAGTLVLSGANTFSGPMVINQGIVNLRHSSALGKSAHGNIVANGAELQLQGGINVVQGGLTVQGSGTSGAGAINSVSGANTLNVQLLFGGATTLGVAAGSLALPGSVSVSHTITTAGAGDLLFNGSVYGSAGFEFNGSGNVTFSNTISAGGAMNLNGGGTVTFGGSGANSNDGAITINNNGTLVLAKAAGTNALQANVTINSGTLRLGASNQMPDSNSVIIGSSAGLFDLNGYSDTIASLTMTGGSVTTGAGTLTLSNSSGAVTTHAAGTAASISGRLGFASSAHTFTVADGGAAVDLDVSAVVSGGTGNHLIKTGAGTMTLSGANTYAGNTTINAGTLQISADNNLGAAPGSASVNKLVLGGGTLFATDSFTLSSNRGITLNAATTSALAAASSETLTYGGILTGAGNLTVGIPSTGTGMVVLSGANTFTGQTHIQAGTVSINTLANVGGGASGLGAPTTAANGTIKLGSGASAGALRYTGAGASSNRVFDLAGTTGGGKIESSGTGALVLTGNITATGAGTKSLTLSGTSTAANTLSGVIANNSGTNKTSLIKDGAGTWILTGANTFTGGVTVASGTLVGSGTTSVGGFARFGDYTAVATPTTVITVQNGATLAVQSTDTAGPGAATPAPNLTLSLSGSGVGGLGALQNLAGHNTWAGNISLAGDSLIRNSATGTDVLWLGAYTWAPPTSFALNNHALTFGGTGDIMVTDSLGNSTGDTGSVTIDMAAAANSVSYAGLRNYYTGATTVKQGTLLSAIYDGNHPNAAILGPLTIGDGTGAAGSAIVTEYYSEQIADNAAVTINADGLLDLASFERNETLSNLTLRGGRISTGLGNLILTGNVAVQTAATSTIDGNMTFGNGTRTFAVDSASTLLLNANLFFGGYVKSGAGTMIVTSDNAAGYLGTTTVAGGILNLRHSNALGQAGYGTPTYGTTVQSGATLQLENVAVTDEHLTLTGTGYNNLGALHSVVGTNTWSGPILLGGDTTIRNTAGLLTLDGGITGAASVTPQTLTFAGNGNMNVAQIDNGTAGGALNVTKQGTGTLSLTGVSHFTGTLAVQAGTVAVTGHNSLASQTNLVSVAGGATLAFSGGGNRSNTIRGLTGAGLVSIAASTVLKVNNPAANTFDGRLSGAGLFEKQGAGTFTFSSAANTSAFNFNGTLQLNAGTLEFQGGSLANALTLGTLQLSGGTLLLSHAFINVGTLNITANTILDFGTGAASILNATNIYIAAGAILTVRNWTSEVDYLFAHSDFRLNNGSGALALFNAEGTAPQNQVRFEGDPLSPDGSHTAWTEYFPGYADHQIRPIPEPGTYGALLLGACVALLGWRRRVQSRAGRRARAQA